MKKLWKLRIFAPKNFNYLNYIIRKVGMWPPTYKISNDKGISNDREDS